MNGPGVGFPTDSAASRLCHMPVLEQIACGQRVLRQTPKEDPNLGGYLHFPQGGPATPLTIHIRGARAAIQPGLAICLRPDKQSVSRADTKHPRLLELPCPEVILDPGRERDRDNGFDIHGEEELVQLFHVLAHRCLDYEVTHPNRRIVLDTNRRAHARRSR